MLIDIGSDSLEVPELYYGIRTYSGHGDFILMITLLIFDDLMFYLSGSYAHRYR